MSAANHRELFDPLIDLPPGIATRPLLEKIAAVASAYQQEVQEGRRGLALIIDDNPQSTADWQLYGQVWSRLRSIDRQADIQELAAAAQTAYQAREQQISWALQALGFDPQEFLNYLATSSPDDHQQSALALSWELFQRHGPCPEDFDPSHRGYAQAADRDRQQRLKLLANLYQEALQNIYDRDSELSSEQLGQISQLEGQFFWTAEHLDLDPGWALQRLQQQISAAAIDAN